MSKNELLTIIENLSNKIEQNELKYVKKEYRQAVQIGQLDSLETLKDIIEWELM